VKRYVDREKVSGSVLVNGRKVANTLIGSTNYGKKHGLLTE
jgi:hypothetical protein